MPWYYYKNGRRAGPIDDAVFRRMAADGQLEPTDFVWSPGMKEWAQAATVPGLLQPPPLPVASQEEVGRLGREGSPALPAPAAAPTATPITVILQTPSKPDQPVPQKGRPLTETGPAQPIRGEVPEKPLDRSPLPSKGDTAKSLPGNEPLSTKWLSFYTFVRLPLSAILVLSQSLGYPGQTLSGTALFMNMVFFVFIVLVVIGLGNRAGWGWRLNYILLTFEALNFASGKTLESKQYGFGFFLIVLVLIGLCWSLPNAIYFWKRRHLFGIDYSDSPDPGRQAGSDWEPGNVQVPSPAAAKQPRRLECPHCHYWLDNASAEPFLVCPSCGVSVGNADRNRSQGTPVEQASDEKPQVFARRRARIAYWLLGITILAVAAWLTRQYVYEPLREAKVRGEAERALASMSFYRELKNYEPSTYESIVQRFSREMKAGKHPSEIAAESSDTVLNLLAKYLPRASDDAVLNYARWFSAKAHEAVRQNPDALFVLVFGGGGKASTGDKASAYQALFKEKDPETLEIMAAILRTGAMQQGRPVDKARGEKLTQKVIERLWPVFGPDLVALADPYKSKVSREKCCKMVLALFDGALSLPPDDGADLLRYLCAEENKDTKN